METKSTLFALRMTEDQRRKLERIAKEMRRSESDAVRILIEDKYSELSGLAQREQVPA